MKLKKLAAIALAAATVATVASFASCSKDEEANKKTLKVVEYTLSEEKYAFAVNEGNTTLKNSADAYLTKIKGDGTFDAIVTKYQDNETDKFVGSNVGTGDPTEDDLVVITNTPFGVFEYVGDDGKYYGIDMEIAAGFAAYLEKDLYIKEWTDFDTILNQFTTYPNAIVMAGLSISADRELIVDFTQEYFSAGQAIISLSSDETFDSCKSVDAVKEKLSSLTGKKVGYQNGTTAGTFLEDYKNVTATGYKTGVLAAQALLNGSVDYVVIDESPAKSIVAQLNKIS